MSVADKKGEIMRLIEQLQPQPGRATALARPATEAASSELREKIAKRRREISEFRAAREKMAVDLLEERVLAICQTLEQRIERIEQLVREGRPAGSPALTRTAPAGTEKPRAAHDESAAELAANLLGIGPDLGVEAALAPAVAPAPTAGEHTLAGEIQEGVLADILQFLSTNLRTGVFVVTSGGAKIDVYLDEGQIVHAVAGDVVGESAFFAAMAAEGGRFVFDELDDLPPDRTISGNTQFIILEALRQIDESGGGRR